MRLNKTEERTMNTKKQTTYFIQYNAQTMASYKSIRACLNHIERKGWKDDADNMLFIVDAEGNPYNPVTGKEEKTFRF